ncbi:sigma factor-like helix-turn-helix DNA-binding protein, partial [Parabacteroides goldsteinii]
LPEQRKRVFLLSREENLKNKEIALRLNISEKAVEKHITKALSDIRTHLTEIGLMSGLICFLLNQH